MLLSFKSLTLDTRSEEKGKWSSPSIIKEIREHQPRVRTLILYQFFLIPYYLSNSRLTWLLKGPLLENLWQRTCFVAITQSYLLGASHFNHPWETEVHSTWPTCRCACIIGAHGSCSTHVGCMVHVCGTWSWSFLHDFLSQSRCFTHPEWADTVLRALGVLFDPKLCFRPI